MSELSDLYQELILDHGKRPRNFKALPGANRHAEGYNPLCGDRITVYANVGDNTIEDISFEGSACAICTASASLMTQTVKGKPTETVRDTFNRFRAMFDDSNSSVEQFEAQLGKLAALAGVRKYPMRVKCATLPWHTLKAAIDNKDETVTTE